MVVGGRKAPDREEFTKSAANGRAISDSRQIVILIDPAAMGYVATQCKRWNGGVLVAEVDAICKRQQVLFDK